MMSLEWGVPPMPSRVFYLQWYSVQYFYYKLSHYKIAMSALSLEAVQDKTSWSVPLHLAWIDLLPHEYSLHLDDR